MARTYVTKKGKRRSRPATIRLEIDSEAISVDLSQERIADALAAAATEEIEKAINTSTRRLKKSSKERRRRAGVGSDKIWIQTGKLKRTVGIRRTSRGDAEIVSDRTLSGRQKGMLLADAGLRGRKRQTVLPELEARVLKHLVSLSQSEEKADDRALGTLIRRNKKGRV